MTSIQKIFKTNIIDPTIKVFSLSDIHGDIQSLIISLRDCAKVIRKKVNSYSLNKQTFYFNKDLYDENMEELLKLDLNNYENIYINDLNYEWCGGNTHIVICGDMIDPFRSPLDKNCLKDGGLACSYYPQIELKILMFINALNIQASSTRGKIVKLLGNHELLNIINEPDWRYNLFYSFKEDQNKLYYKGTSRLDIFRVGNHGFNLLLEGGCGILIKINNAIFVHGDLVESYDTYDNLNQFINNPQEKQQIKWNNYFYTHIDNTKSLFSRNRGDNKLVNKRIFEKNSGNESEQILFCDNLIESFKEFKGDGEVITEFVNRLMLVIGHCPQYMNSTLDPNGQNETYSTKIKEDDVMEVFGHDIYSGVPNFNRNDKRTKIFGITMECLIPNTKLNRLYRIDVGSSRGFDIYDKMLPQTLEDENKFLYSKTPQILEINTDGSVNIIKSKMRNTRIHLPRPTYEQHAKFISELNIHTNPIQNHYKQKYIKYKNKYLQLKKKI
jgi:hypothetical protein